MTVIKQYKDINEYLEAIGIPILEHEDFYIVKFELEFVTGNAPISYKHNYFEISFALGYDALVTVGKDEINPFLNSPINLFEKLAMLWGLKTILIL